MVPNQPDILCINPYQSMFQNTDTESMAMGMSANVLSKSLAIATARASGENCHSMVILGGEKRDSQ